MSVLVVQSHPREKSFNEAILTRVISHLDAARTDTTLIRLGKEKTILDTCLLYTSPSPRDATLSRMPSSA